MKTAIKCLSLLLITTLISGCYENLPEGEQEVPDYLNGVWSATVLNNVNDQSIYYQISKSAGQVSLKMVRWSKDTFTQPEDTILKCYSISGRSVFAISPVKSNTYVFVALSSVSGDRTSLEFSQIEPLGTDDKTLQSKAAKSNLTLGISKALRKNPSGPSFLRLTKLATSVLPSVPSEVIAASQVREMHERRTAQKTNPAPRALAAEDPPSDRRGRMRLRVPEGVTVQIGDELKTPQNGQIYLSTPEPVNASGGARYSIKVMGVINGLNIVDQLSAFLTPNTVTEIDLRDFFQPNSANRTHLLWTEMANRFHHDIGPKPEDRSERTNNPTYQWYQAMTDALNSLPFRGADERSVAALKNLAGFTNLKARQWKSPLESSIRSALTSEGLGDYLGKTIKSYAELDALEERVKADLEQARVLAERTYGITLPR